MKRRASSPSPCKKVMAAQLEQVAMSRGRQEGATRKSLMGSDVLVLLGRGGATLVFRESRTNTSLRVNVQEETAEHLL